jgi:2-phospho-L-lactate guanylyltransferase
VKRPELAKTRLADAVGDLRPHLARAFAADTVAAVLACSAVAAVVVVTDDDDAAVVARALGATVIADAPDAGLNAALRHGADEILAAHPDASLAALAADLPALRPDELGRVLSAAGHHGQSFVSDAAGIGTTLYAARHGSTFDPRFGGRSRASHRAAGAVELQLDGIASIRRDIDTAVDLWDAARLGLGPRTSALVSALDVAI